ncbi:MAG: D-alanyl-D-alanine carboxypeptidase/D-alanyl-D-alanine-endopeptidase [Bifidobacteriaceae bacterium]|nr:D-alanyl-D-alanine carboxypeptidase/D-alanyl-D-alanine-endopeptidase [Bifidobacteriaceae bacterium]
MNRHRKSSSAGRHRRRCWQAGATALAALVAALGLPAPGGAGGGPALAAAPPLENPRQAAATLQPQVTPVADLLDPDAPAPAPGALRDLAAAHLAATQVGPASVSVRDLASGEELFAISPDQPLPPASTVKILTATAALAVLGPDSTLSTAAVMSVTGPASGIVTLVAGGDMALAPDAGRPAEAMGHAGLGDLARAAAVELRRRGVQNVEVRLDDTIFSGPAVYPDWEWSLGSTWGSPTAPLAVLGGRAGAAFDAVTYVADPALAAARQFRGLLAQAGQDAGLALPTFAVAGGVTRAAAPAEAELLAQVDSAPVRDLVAHLLRQSDNNMADSLGRVTALALGQPGSFAGCAAAVTQTLDELGVVTAGLKMDDCSGLSHGSAVSAATVTSALALSAGPEAGALGAVARDLPAGALQGTLAGRFHETAAAGNVRAKTGTLTGVTALAGTVQTAGGRELVFAIIANPGNAIWTDLARQSVDRFVAALAGLP